MSILLAILKILGILLLVLLGIVLFLVLSFLFFPVYYRMSGEYEEKFQLNIKAGWLCRLLYFRFYMVNGEMKAVFRILGIPIFRLPAVEKVRKPNAKKRRRRKKRKKTAKGEKRRSSKEDKAAPNRSKIQIEEKKKAQNPEASEHTMPMRVNREQQQINGVLEQQRDASSEQTQAESPQIKQPATDSRQKSTVKKERSIIEKIRQLPENIKRVFLRIYEKIKALFLHVSDIKSIWMDENNRVGITLIFKEVKYLLFHYGPTKIRADARFGIGNPAATGQVLGIISMIPFVYQKGVHIEPDFETEQFYAQGWFRASGHIRMLHLLRSLMHAWKNETIKKWIKDNILSGGN